MASDEHNLQRFLHALAELGEQAAMLPAAFKHALGTTPAAYVLDWRLGLAATRLREGRAVKQVAHELGFAGAGALSKGFRRRYGVAPRAWAQPGAVAGALPQRGD